MKDLVNPFPESHMTPVPNTSGVTIASNSKIILPDGRLGIINSDTPSGRTGYAATEGNFNLPKDTATAFSRGDRIAWDPVGAKIVPWTVGRGVHGIMLTDAAMSATFGLVAINKGGGARFTGASIAASTEVAAATTNAQVFDVTRTVSKNNVGVATVVRGKLLVDMTGKNGADTCQMRLLFGATVVADTGAGFAFAVGQYKVIEFEAVIRATGAGGKCIACGFYGDATSKAIPFGKAEFALDTTADLVISADIAFSSANAANKAKLQMLDVQVFPGA